jgi:hypothetical protein
MTAHLIRPVKFVLYFNGHTHSRIDQQNIYVRFYLVVFAVDGDALAGATEAVLGKIFPESGGDKGFDESAQGTVETTNIVTHPGRRFSPGG